MRRIIHKIKAFFNKIGYYLKLLNWARSHSKQVKNYEFLVKLRKVANDELLKMERESRPDKVSKLETQVKLIDKILNYVRN